MDYTHVMEKHCLTKIRLCFLFKSYLVFSTLYTSNRLLGYNMMLTSQFASQGFINYSWHLHVMAWKYISSLDLQGALLSKMFQIIMTFLQNCLISFVVSHKALETILVAAPAMLEFTTKLCNLICSV